MSTKEEQRDHERGQQDASEGRYKPPHDTPLGGITHSKQQARENDSYNQGYRNTKEQKKKK